MNDGISGADIVQKLVAQTLSLGRALHQTRDIHEFYDGIGLLFWLVHVGEPVQPLVRNSHRTNVGLYGAERVVCGLGAGVCYGVEKSGFSHIGQSYDTKFHLTLPLKTAFGRSGKTALSIIFHYRSRCCPSLPPPRARVRPHRFFLAHRKARRRSSARRRSPWICASRGARCCRP